MKRKERTTRVINDETVEMPGRKEPMRLTSADAPEKEQLYSGKTTRKMVVNGFAYLIGMGALILPLVMLAGCGQKEAGKKSLQVKGSDSEVNVVQRLAEDFMKKHPEVSIAITGGGSGTGIAALVNKQTDIANSSRPMKEEELKQAENSGVNPVAVIFALDGLSVITHQNLSVDSLSIGEIANIFRGEITNWKEVGGPDLAILLYGRQSNSGTYIYFRDNVLKGDYSPQVRAMNGNAQIVEAIKNDKGGIGYVGLGYVVDDEGKVIPGVTVLSIAQDENSPAVTPLEPENVKSGLYPLSRPLYQFTNGKPEGQLLEFIRFELSEEGQGIVAKEGYYPIPSQYMEANRSSGIIE